jgi:hypothetical protein
VSIGLAALDGTGITPLRVGVSSLSVPSAAAIWVVVRTSILGVVVISSIRRCDIRAARASPRTTIVACWEYRARLTAAWPVRTRVRRLSRSRLPYLTAALALISGAQDFELYL